MKLLLVISVFLSVSSTSILQNVDEEYNNGDRYIYFPGDGDNKMHLVDLFEPVDEEAIEIYLRSPENNNYWLFTRSNPISSQVLIMNNKDSINRSNFNNSKEIVFLAHGWNGNGNNEMNIILREAFLEAGDVNVIVLDWSRLATRNYVTARNSVPAVGRQLGMFIGWLITLGVTYDKIHLVGFSLGAHLVGNAGREVNGRVMRITALDPAGPLWNGNSGRIVQTDGRYVEVIHTNTKMYGYTDPCGHVDYYPNGGRSMPGCWLSSCSHSKSYKYMAATVKYDHLHGNQCETHEDAIRDHCFGDFFSMGNSKINKMGSGIFRVNTGRAYPF